MHLYTQINNCCQGGARNNLLSWPLMIYQNSYRIYNSVLYNNYTAGARLGDDDHSSIYNKLEDKAAKWRDIGKELGFKEGEMDNIQSNPMLLTQSAPNSYLREMLTKWLQWAPGDRRGSTGYATKESLRTALLRTNLGQLAEQFQ